MENKKLKEKILIIAYVLLFVIYIIKPICFDVKLYIEAAERADAIGKFPDNIFSAWEHKYILNRLIFYILLKITKIFVSVDNIMLFEIIIKAIYGILSIAIIKIFSKSTKNFFSKYKISETVVFGILYFSIIGSGIYFSMQTEMTAFLLTLISIIFILKEKLIYKIISAFIISTLFWFKGVTLLYSVIVLVVMLLNKNNRKEILFVICWSIIFLLSELLLIYYIEPYEIENMYLATQYINFDLDYKLAFEYIIFDLFFYNMFIIGILAFIKNMINHIKHKNIKLLILEILTWFVLACGVCIQKLYCFYQTGLMIVAIIFSIFIFIYYKNSIDNKRSIPSIMVVVFVILTVMPTNMICELAYTVQIYKNTFESVKELKKLEDEIPDLKEEVLYIGNGLSSYYIKAKSYTNYTTTIFLANDNEKYQNSSYIDNLKTEIKNYTGKYIIIDQIEFIKKFRISDDIIKFIEENYHYKQSTNISIYEFNAEDEYEYSVIYERND